MILQLVENVERDLQNTTIIKNNLSAICDASWSLLCPPGKGIAGKFIPEKPQTSNESKSNSEGSSNNDLYSNVTEVIKYAKHLRSNKDNSNKNASVKLNNDKKNSVMAKHLEKIPIRSKCPSLKTEASTSSQLTRNLTNNVSRNGLNERVGDKRFAWRENAPSSHAVVRYSHSCSSKLSGQVNSMKMSEDLNNLLSLFNSYVDLNPYIPDKTISKRRDAEQIFSNKFNKCIKSKLQDDLQTTNQCNKYMSYVEFSEEAVKSTKFQEPPLKLCYKSLEQLELFEKTSHKLFELQLQSKVLNAVLDFLNESFEYNF